ARGLVQGEVSVERAALRWRVEDALAVVGPREPIRIRMGTAEIQYAVSKRPEHFHAGIELVEDSSLGIGGCVVETPHRVIDATIETRLMAIKDALEVALENAEQTDAQ